MTAPPMRTSLPTDPELPTQPNVHRFAVFTACCTFLLLIAGALVTSNDAGLSVPDWPLSYGSLLPPMVGGIFYEHGHRMIAAFVGMLSIVLAVWLWRVETRAWVRWLGRRGTGRGDRAGHPRRHHGAVLPAGSDFRGARHACAALFLHDPQHRPVHQRLVGAATVLRAVLRALITEHLAFTPWPSPRPRATLCS